MPLTPQLLARLSGLDDLVELVVALGFAPAGEELNAVARERLGLSGDGLGVRRAAQLGRHGHFRVYGVLLAEAGRARVAQAVERLARAAPGERNLLFALDQSGGLLAAAAVAPSLGGQRARQLRVDLRRPSAVAAEILSGLAPRPDESALALSARAADVLAEEGLTARFFREFARLHERAARSLCAMPRATTTERRDLALVILTRVLFLYFVQAKGWLAGRSDFLPSLLDPALGRGHPFHHTVFEPLCFGALNTPAVARRPAARALGKVPFLNGGLFERHALERRYRTACLPNETWRELLDDLFERFHFTVRERDDADAVDPEMLGRVFEGLMARERRCASGTFFTPQELLATTVRAALEAALDGAPPQAVRGVRVLDPAVGSGAFLLEALHQLEERRAALWPSESPSARRRAIVRDCLFGVDLDPMAVRLAELRLWLALVADDDASWETVAPLPNLDQNLRQGDSLLSPLDLVAPSRVPALRGRLRAVAERRSEYFAATGPDKAALARRIREDERAVARDGAEAELAALTARLADAAATTGRDLFGRRARRPPVIERRVAYWRQARRELVALRLRLVNDDALPFFSYDVHFGDILAEGGFDLVLGNPPWVRGERLPGTTRSRLSSRYAAFRAASVASGGFAHLPDLSVAFVERALQLARPSGVVGFVLPAKLLRAGYAGPLRALLREQATVVRLDDRAHAPSDFAATVFPLIAVLRRRAPSPASPARVSLIGASGLAVAGLAAQEDVPLEPDVPRSPWLALPSDLVRLVRAALHSGRRLAACFRPTLGVKTGANEIFVRDLAHAGDLPASGRVPAVLGRDVAPFAIRPSAVLLALMDAAGRPLPSVPAPVADYLGIHLRTLRRRSDARASVPWALFRTELVRARWAVLWRDIAPGLEAAILERETPSAPVPLNTCYGVAVPDRYTAHWLCAYLNSRLTGALALVLAERASGGAFRFSAATIAALPLPAHPQSPSVRALAAIARKAAEGGSWDLDELDTHAALALGLDGRATAALRRLDETLRRDAGGHR